MSSLSHDDAHNPNSLIYYAPPRIRNAHRRSMGPILENLRHSQPAADSHIAAALRQVRNDDELISPLGLHQGHQKNELLGIIKRFAIAAAVAAVIAGIIVTVFPGHQRAHGLSSDDLTSILTAAQPKKVTTVSFQRSVDAEPPVEAAQESIAVERLSEPTSVERSPNVAVETADPSLSLDAVTSATLNQIASHGIAPSAESSPLQMWALLPTAQASSIAVISPSPRVRVASHRQKHGQRHLAEAR